MAYYADVKLAVPNYESLTRTNFCFECGGAIENGVVLYDGYVGHGTANTISLHPACAAAIGQRLIADGYLNRKKN